MRDKLAVVFASGAAPLLPVDGFEHAIEQCAVRLEFQECLDRLRLFDFKRVAFPENQKQAPSVQSPFGG